MLYVAGEIFLWMLLAFALGVLVGWFVWGVRQRKVATTKQALAAAPGAAGTSSTDIESVTVRPVIRPKAPPEPGEQLPVTPPAGTPVVPPESATLASEPEEPGAPEAPESASTEGAEADGAPAGSAASAEPAGEVPGEPSVPEEATGSPALAALVTDDDPPADAAPGDQAVHGDPAAAGPARAPIGNDPAPTPAVGLAPVTSEPGEPGGTATGHDDLTVVGGIDPGIAAVLKESGIGTWDTLAAATPDRLRTILDLAGDQYRAHDPSTWPHQAELAAAGRWDDLSSLQATLTGGPPG